MEIVIVVGVLVLAVIVVILSSVAVQYVVDKGWNDEPLVKVVMKVLGFVIIICVCLYLIYDVASICWAVSKYGWIK